MKVLMVNGSPHAKGCTYTALCAIGEELAKNGIEYEIFQLGLEPIGGCRSCRACKKMEGCVFGGIVNEFIEKAKTADAFVFGSPVHFAAASGNITSFLDRVFYAGSRHLAFKPAAICCSARRAGTTATLEQLAKYPEIAQMPLVNASYWPMVHGNTPEEVLQDAEGMCVMHQLGQNLSWLLQCIELGKASGIEHPPLVARPMTNFIR